MLCWFFRLLISNAMDEDKQPSGITRKHISDCADCRRFYNVSLSLAESLKQEESVSTDGTYRRLNKRILRALPARRTVKNNVEMKLWTAAVAACIALIFLHNFYTLDKLFQDLHPNQDHRH